LLGRDSGIYEKSPNPGRRRRRLAYQFLYRTKARPAMAAATPAKVFWAAPAVTTGTSGLEPVPVVSGVSGLAGVSGVSGLAGVSGCSGLAGVSGCSGV